MAKNKISQEQYNKSVEMFNQGLTVKEIEKSLGISEQSIYRNLKKLGVEFNSNKSTISYEDAATLYQKSEMILKDFCKENKISYKWFREYLIKNNINYKINQQNVTKFNEHIFDEIDTEEKAYWLGFIYADGCIQSHKEGVKKGYDFELSLALKDLEHLNKFNTFMEHINKNHISCDSYRCRFIISNKHLWNILNNYGCTPRKSLTLEFPDESIFKSKDLIRHFIRGYFDGDGCLSWANIEHTKPSISVLGTENFLNKMQNFLPLIKTYKLQPNSKNNDNNITKVLSINGSNAINLAEYLYENSTIFLARKLEVYKLFLNCRFKQ